MWCLGILAARRDWPSCTGHSRNSAYNMSFNILLTLFFLKVSLGEVSLLGNYSFTHNIEDYGNWSVLHVKARCTILNIVIICNEWNYRSHKKGKCPLRNADFPHKLKELKKPIDFKKADFKDYVLLLL